MINRMIGWFRFFFPFVSEKLIRFLIVGGVSTFVNYGVFYLLLLAGINYLVSAVAGYVVGLLFGFFMNKRWTYGEHVRQNSEKIYIYKYVLVYLINLAISTLFLKGLVDYCGLDARIGNVCAIMLSTCMNYIGLNMVVFNETNRGVSR